MVFTIELKKNGIVQKKQLKKAFNAKKHLRNVFLI